MLLTSRDIHYIYDWGGCRGEPVCGPAMAGVASDACRTGLCLHGSEGETES